MLEDCAGWAPPGYKPNPETMGEMRSYIYARGVHRNAGRIRPNGVVGHIFLNKRDLANKPSEIIAHECAHAGMAWVRLHRAKLEHMHGEEVLCHAVGRLVQQVNRVCYAAKAFGE